MQNPSLHQQPLLHGKRWYCVERERSGMQVARFSGFYWKQDSTIRDSKHNLTYFWLSTSISDNFKFNIIRYIHISMYGWSYIDCPYSLDPIRRQYERFFFYRWYSEVTLRFLVFLQRPWRPVWLDSRYINHVNDLAHNHIKQRTNDNNACILKISIRNCRK